MRFISWLFSVLIILVCACFAVSNKQDITVDLWPVGYVITSPLYIVTLGTFFGGFLLGSFLFWMAGLGHRWEKRRLAKQVAKLKLQLEQEVAKNTAPVIAARPTPAPLPPTPLAPPL